MITRPASPSRVGSRSGFSLVEVMVASLVLILLFISSITALQAGFRMIDNARMANRTFHMNAAMNLAEAGIEEGLYALNKFKGSSSSSKDYSAFPTGTDGWELNIEGDGDGAARSPTSRAIREQRVSSP